MGQNMTGNLARVPLQILLQGTLKGEVSLDWSGISCMTTDNFRFYLQNRLIQTGQTGGQLYSDTSPFSVPCYLPFSLSSGLYYKNMKIVNDASIVVSE
jgi:hypothetical protein